MVEIPPPFTIADAEEALRRCFPGLEVRTAEPALQGWDSLVLVVNREWMFKFPRRPEVGRQLLIEARLLAALAPVLPLPIPRPHFLWHGGESHPNPILGYRKIPGIELSKEIVDQGDPARLAEQLGRFLAALHAFPLPEAVELGLHEATPEAWREGYRQLFRRVRETVFPALEPRWGQQIAAVMEEYLADDTYADFRPALVHTDLGREHILCDVRGRHVEGIIDWTDALIGDPAIDFVGLWWMDRSFARRVLAAYGESQVDDFLRRVAFYERMVPLYELLHWAETGATHALEEGRGDLVKVYS